MKKSYKEYPISEDFLCIPTVLYTIINSAGYVNIGIHDIANYLGINLPLNYKLNNEKVINVKHVDDIKMYGVVLKDESINNLFKKFGISLREQYYPISNFNDYTFENEINHILSDINCSLIVGLDFGVLINDSSRNGYGHVCIILGIENDYCIIYNPGPYMHGEMSIKIDDLYSAIRIKEDGLWKINNI